MMDSSSYINAQLDALERTRPSYVTASSPASIAKGAAAKSNYENMIDLYIGVYCIVCDLDAGTPKVDGVSGFKVTEPSMLLQLHLTELCCGCVGRAA